MITKDFLLAGKAIFTIANPEKKRYTYKVVYSKNIEKYFAYVLTGKNNKKDYTYLGMVVGDNPKLVLTKKSKYNYESLLVKVFDYSLTIINGYRKLKDGYFLEHEGYCGKCGRPLTTPESIKAGLGPVCRGKL